MSSYNSMPSSQQQWAHATNSTTKLQDALSNPDITAIEAVLLMGLRQRRCEAEASESREEHNNAGRQGNRNNRKQEEQEEEEMMIVPIMSHPPERVSDLSAEMFLQQVIREDLCPQSGKEKRRRLEKHIKLDFKDMDAVEPTLTMFKDIDVCIEERTLFLNADVLPGPGRFAEDVKISADHFIEHCMRIISDDESRGVVFSLGFSVDVLHPFGHTEKHLDDMICLVRKHDLMNRSAGVVLAINARLLVKNMVPFEKFLDHYPSSQLLIWTATGEPPISQRKIRSIERHFGSHGTLDRVGFDCNVAETFFAGLFYDVCLDLYGLFLFIIKIINSWTTAAIQIRKDKQS